MTHALVRPLRASALALESPERPRRSLVLLVFALGVLTAAGPLATDLYLPAFPEIARDLEAPQSRVQLTLVATMVGIAVGQLLIGPMSDAWGRRKPLLVGMAVFTATSFLGAAAPTAETLIALRFVQGLSGAAGAVVSRAIVRDLFEGDTAARLFSRLILIVGLAPMLGPILGGQLLLVTSWHWAFLALGVAGLVCLGLAAVLPESLPAAQRQPLQPSALATTFTRLLRDPRFIVPTLTLGLSFGMSFTYISAFSFVSQNEFGATAQQFSLVFAVNTTGMVLGTQLNAALIGRVDVGRLTLVGLLGSVVTVVALVAVAFGGAPGLLTVTALLFAMMVCTGFISPNTTTMAIASQDPHTAGSASALLGTLQFTLGGGLAAFAGLTGSGEATFVSMATVMLGTILAATAVFLRAPARRRPLAA